MLSDLPRRPKTPPPDPVEVERRLLQETIDEVAGLVPETDDNELIEEPMINVYEEAKRRGIQLPEYLAQPYPIEQSVMNPSMQRENGVDSLEQNLLEVGPATSHIDNFTELPEATVDEIADMGLFAGDGGLKLFNSLVARERTTNHEIRETVRQRQAAKSLQPIPVTAAIPDLPAAQADLHELDKSSTPQALPAQRTTAIGTAMQSSELLEELPVQEVEQVQVQDGTINTQAGPEPAPADAIDETLVGTTAVPQQQKKKKRRRKPRKQRSPSPDEYVEFPEMHRELIRHKRKPRKIRQNQPQVRALANPMMDIFAGIDDYGLDIAYVSSEDETPIVQVTPRPAPAVPEVADAPELDPFINPDAEPTITDDQMTTPPIIDVQTPTPPLESDPPRDGHESKRPRFDTMASILSPSVSLIPGIRDIPASKPNGQRFTTDDMAYSYLNEKSQQALMTPEQRAMTRDELLLHEIRQAKEQEVAKKAAASGTGKDAEPDSEVLYQRFQGKSETMIRFVGLDGKIEEHPEYAIETVSVYLQLRMFMAKNQWRMKWDDIWENFEIPEKATTKQMLDMRLYYLSEKGLVFLHLNDEGAILEVEIKVKPKTVEEKRAKQAKRTKHAAGK